MQPLFISPKEAISLIQSHQRVFIHGGAATPSILIDELVNQAHRLRAVELIHLHTEGDAPYALPQFKESFRVANLFLGQNMRRRIDYNQVDYIPCFLSEIPELFRSTRPLDVALVHISPPDRNGFCSLGTSVDVAKTAVDCARIVIAQVNPHMPRVHGDGWVHLSKISALVEVDKPLPTSTLAEPGEAELGIARFVSEMIEDGSTLQMGIGAIPDAVARNLSGHKNLGVHSEMWSDGTLKLILSGAVNNSQKKVHTGKTVSGFIIGSRSLYDFVNDNPSVIQLGTDYVNNPFIIARNRKVVAINSAVEIDLTGQVCADSIGHKIISGVGGQMDFMRGAALSPGGKPIIAMTSTTKSGESKIVFTLKPGSGVVTTRADVHYVVTEFGVADLRGKSLRERASSLIKIAHPRHREELERSYYKI